MTTRDLVRVAEVRIGVPEPDVSADFFEHALEFHRTSSGGQEYLTGHGDYGLGTPPSMLTLVQADEVSVDEVALEFGDGVAADALVDRLNAADVRYERESNEIVFHDPDGIAIRCRERVPPIDDRPAVSAVRPRRLGHINLKVPDAPRSAAFWADVVGLALSERVGELLYFFRAGSEHHNVGIRGMADRATVHHVAFEIHGWESYRVICDRLADLGHRVEYGPGRHGPGNNLFVYVREPSSGLRLELYADMAHIDDDNAYEPPVWETGDRSRTMNRWGPGPPESFLE